MDRVKIIKNIKKEENFNYIKEYFKVNGKNIYNVNSFQTKYYIKTKNFNMFLFIKSGFLVLDFNIARNKYNVNFGEVTTKDVEQFIINTNKYLKTYLNLDTDIRLWKMLTIEINKDVKYKNNLIAQNIIDTLKKCQKGNLKYKNYKTSYFRRNKNTKICVYRKDLELKTQNNWSKLTEKQKERIENTIRFEVQLNHKKLCYVLSKLKKTEVKKVVFADMLNPYLQDIIHKEIFKNLNFEKELNTKKELEQKIKELPFQKRKIKNMINFMQDLNTLSFNTMRKKYPSCYNYLKIFRENNICPFYLEEIKNIICGSAQIQKERKKHSLFLLKQFLKDNKITENIDVYNIWGLFLNFNNINLNLRI